MIFLRQTFFNTTTVATVESGTNTVVNMIDKKASTQYETVGFNDDTTSTTIFLNFPSTQTVSNIALLNHNLKDYSIAINPIGTLISSFSSTTYDATATNPVGIDIATDGSYWISNSGNDKIQNVDITGTLLSGFATSVYDTSATLPVGMAVATGGSLWVGDQSSKTIYNVDITGTLLSSFTTGAYGASAHTVGDIAVATDGSLYIIGTSIAPFQGIIFHVSPDSPTGGLIDSFTSGVYDTNETTPQGIAVATGGSLYIGGIITNKIHNVSPDSPTGSLISFFKSSRYANATITSGVAVATDGSLVICTEDTNGIYHVKGAADTTTTYTTNSETSQYIKIGITSAKSILATMNKTITANEEKKVGEFIISNLFYDFATDRLPTSRNYRPEIRKKQIVHKMSDGGINLYNIADKFRARIRLDFVPTSTETILKSVFDDPDPVIFIPFETTTSWNADIYEVNWTGHYNIMQFSDNNRDVGFKGQIRLKETTGRI